MSGIKVVQDNFGSTRVWFCGGFEVLRPSTKEALQNTSITIHGQVTRVEDDKIVSYPVGAFHCTLCNNWVNINEEEHAYAVRTCSAGLHYSSLLCESCTDVFDINGVRCAALCSDEWVALYRLGMSRASAKQCARKWRRNVVKRKEKRTMARHVSLVLARCVSNVQANDIFNMIMSFALA
jgi:hypothetical protein